MENGPFGHAAGRWRDGDGWRAGRVCWVVMERGQGRAQARADGWIVAAGVAYWQGCHGCPVAHGRTALDNCWPNVAVMVGLNGCSGR
ncbi:hypothetical protein ACLOJK_022910, partial [Asimina triloba]